MLIVFVDPKISVLADDVINQHCSYLKLKSVALMMITSRLLGAVVAQLFFLPGAKYFARFTRFTV